MDDGKATGKKRPCPDCTFCQWCSDDRCRICRGEKGCVRKLSSAEQIALYERINCGAASACSSPLEKKQPSPRQETPALEEEATVSAKDHADQEKDQ